VLSDDPSLGPVIETYPEGSLVAKGDLFRTFTNAIVGQQISVIAADAIWNRLIKKVGEITPENLRKFSLEEISSCGLTKSKADYILGVASVSEEFLKPNWKEMTDKEVKDHFISFRGIGPWTAEMIMIFGLLRRDVFSIGDIGLVKAVKLLEPSLETKEDVLKFAERWKPYRTAASWYLWRMLDPVPVAY